jgi:hypothetical protein
MDMHFINSYQSSINATAIIQICLEFRESAVAQLWPLRVMKKMILVEFGVQNASIFTEIASQLQDPTIFHL